MCACFMSRKSHQSKASGSATQLAKETSCSDISDAFLSLSIQDEPIAGAKSPVVKQAVQPVSPPKIPTFPMPNWPRCPECDTIPEKRRVVSELNLNGNARRPFFTCQRCKDDLEIPGNEMDKGWISWDDNVGVHENNKPCFCGLVCRQDRIGRSKGPSRGKGFWTCAIGLCDYYSERRDALTDYEACKNGMPPDDGFHPWLL